MKDAQCKGRPHRIFYEDIWPNPEVTLMPDVKALERAREHFCSRCPVRPECFVLAMDAEKRETVFQRSGLYGGLTPHQRHSLEKRGVDARCICGAPRDPDDLRQGKIRCNEACGINNETMPTLPDRGDEWMGRHTILAQKVVAWLVENIPLDNPIPTPSRLSKTLSARVSDMRRVYSALLADGSIANEDGVLVRRSCGTVNNWLPPHLRDV